MLAALHGLRKDGYQSSHGACMRNAKEAAGGNALPHKKNTHLVALEQVLPVPGLRVLGVAQQDLVALTLAAQQPDGDVGVGAGAHLVAGLDRNLVAGHVPGDALHGGGHQRHAAPLAVDPVAEGGGVGPAALQVHHL